MATGDVIAADSEVFSATSRRLSTWMDTSEDAQTVRTSFTTTTSTIEPPELQFLNITCPEGVIRDAAVLQSRYLAFQLNENDVDDFLLSFSTVQETKAWIQSLMMCLSQSWKVTSEALHALETLWTAKFRPPPENHRHDEIFYVNIAINMFMTEMWEPVRQLTCFAISVRALQRILSGAEIIHEFEWTRSPFIGFSAIETLLRRVLNQSILDNITAAVSMMCMTSCFSDRSKRIPFQLLVTRYSGLYAGFQWDNSPFLIPTVTSIYENHKIGRREPRDRYLCFSSLRVKQTIIYRGNEIQLWPDLPPLVLAGSVKVVLIDGILTGHDSPRRGLFIFQDLVDTEALLETLSTTLKFGPYFKTAPVLHSSFHSGHFRYLNLPVRLGEDWHTKGIGEDIRNWMENLKIQMGQEDHRPGNRYSFPMVIS